jgi:class 3 adenylate cyclase/CheY-like chemotaxis protein
MKEYKILIVDDQPENLEVIVNIVERSGDNFEVLQALNGRTATFIAKEEIPDLVITDWEMPDVDGIELIKALKADEQLVDVPIIMCTGIMTTSDNLQTALEAGAVDFIRKPVDEIELKARLKSMLQLSDSYKTIKQQMKQIAEEKEKSDNLLLNILPKATADELKENGSATPKSYEMVSVLFTDFKGFTKAASTMTPEELIEDLGECFSAFDSIIDEHNIEKIKTIGDAYMCAGGLPLANTSNALDTVNAAFEMRGWITSWNDKREQEGKTRWEIRIGIHTGELVAGVIGTKKFAYDLWGDAVNVASRLESNGEPGKINISGTTYERVKDHFNCDFRGEIEAKNRGKIAMYFVDSKK